MCKPWRDSFKAAKCKAKAPSPSKISSQSILITSHWEVISSVTAFENKEEQAEETGGIYISYIYL